MARGSSPFSSEEELIRHVDETYGLRNVKPEWVSEQTASRQNSLIRSICNKDIREISNGSLPWRPQDAHSVQLGVKVLVQIEEVSNVAASDRQAAFPRLLQFSLTDGAVTFIAIELDTTSSKFTTDTIGTKLVLEPSALVRRGRVILASADYTLLGSPQKSVRPNRSEALPSNVGFAQNADRAGSNVVGSSGTRRWNPATGITGIGGIADISQQVDEDADNDCIPIESHGSRSLYPPPVRERTIRLPTRWNDENRGDPVRRIPPNGQLPDNARKAQARKNERNEREFERRTTSMAVRSPSTNNRPPVPPFPKQVNATPIQGFFQGNAVRELTFQEPAVSKQVPQPADVALEESPEPAQELERMNIRDGNSTQTRCLTRLSDIAASSGEKPGVCRFYAMKVAKKVEGQLMSEGAVSTIVDDGSCVKVIAFSNELVNTLRDGLPSRNEEFSQGAYGDVRRSLRSVCGFFRMECQRGVLAAASLVSENAVSDEQSVMLSKFLSKVTSRYAAYECSTKT